MPPLVQIYSPGLQYWGFVIPVHKAFNFRGLEIHKNWGRGLEIPTNGRAGGTGTRFC